MAWGLEQRVVHARALCEQGSWPDLLEFSQTWQVENPDAAKAFFYRGVALTALGRLLEAQTSYRRALELDAADFKTWNNLAALLFEKLDRPLEAIQCLNEALKTDSRNALGWANLASMNGQLGRHAHALACADRALMLDPQLPEALMLRARAAQKLGKLEITQAMIEVLAQLPPEKFQARLQG